MTPEYGEADLNPRTSDWIDFFRNFEEDSDLRPHHNVELPALFSEDDRKESGKIIYYYGEKGSFWLSYDKDAYEEGTIAEGTVELRSEYIELSPFESPEEIAGMLNEYQNKSSQQAYLKAPNSETRRTTPTILANMVFPQDSPDRKVKESKGVGKSVMDFLERSVCTDNSSYEAFLKTVSRA